MGTIILADSGVYQKGREIFEAEKPFEVREAPEDEKGLADAIRETQGCRAVIIGTTPYTGPLYEALGERATPEKPGLIARFGVGHDSVNKELAAQNNLRVTITPGVLDDSVAEHTIWLMGSLLRHIHHLDRGMRGGQFIQNRTGFEARGRTLAIAGFGNIGRKVARIAHQGLGMRIIAAGQERIEDMAQREQMDYEIFLKTYGLEVYSAEVDPILSKADIVSVHLPVTEATRHFFNRERLARLNRSALLLNTARGALVDENALYDALEGGKLAGAALDVFEKEPYVPGQAEKDLRRLDNILLSSHAGSNTRESNQRMASSCLESVTAFFAGNLMDTHNVIA